MSVAQMGYPAPPDPQLTPQTVTSVNTLITALTSTVRCVEFPNGVLPNNTIVPIANTMPQGAGLMTIGCMLNPATIDNPPFQVLINSNNGAGGNPAYNFYAYPSLYADEFPGSGNTYSFTATVPFINTTANVGTVFLTCDSIGQTDTGFEDLQVTFVNFGIMPPIQ
jgi:hypothetical protein